MKFSFSILDKIRFRKESTDSKVVETKESHKKESKSAFEEIIIESTPTKPSKPIRYMVDDGPHFFIAKTIYTKGPMTTSQLWQEYQNDKEALSKNYFISKSFMKKKVILTMKKLGKLTSGTFNPATNSYIGFRINPKNAFKKVNPEIMPELHKLAAENRIVQNFKKKQTILRIEPNFGKESSA